MQPSRDLVEGEERKVQRAVQSSAVEIINKVRTSSAPSPSAQSPRGQTWSCLSFSLMAAGWLDISPVISGRYRHCLAWSDPTGLYKARCVLPCMMDCSGIRHGDGTQYSLRGIVILL